MAFKPFTKQDAGEPDADDKKAPKGKKKGAKIDSIVLQPAIAQLHAVAVVAKSTRPFSAVLLYDFFLSEGQPILAAKDFVPSSARVPSPYGNMPIKFIDPVESLERQDAWQKEYDAIFLKRGR